MLPPASQTKRRASLTRALSLGLVALVVGLVAGLVTGRVAEARTEGAEDEPWRQLRPVRGRERTHVVEAGQTLHDVAWQYRLGYEALARLNPALDPWLLAPGTKVRLPTRYVLPVVEQTGLVVNLPEMRLFDFTRTGAIDVHAVAIGDPEDPTPIGRFTIGAKRKDPWWKVPAGIRARDPGLPPLVRPGEDNPLGSRWMTLGRSTYGLHGTNVRWSIGRGSTHGCVRLYEDVIVDLFERVPSGTPVTLIYETVKWGTNGKALFVEVHPDIYGRQPEPWPIALALPRRLGILDRIDLDRLKQAVEASAGVPVRVGELP